MKRLNITYEGKPLYDGSILELTPLGINIECSFELIEKLKTNNGKFKIVSFDLDSGADIGSIRGELCVHSMRKVKQDTCLMTLRFFQPRQDMLAQVKHLISIGINKPKVMERLSTIKQADIGDNNFALLDGFENQQQYRAVN